jgi:hypothetical protein
MTTSRQRQAICSTLHHHSRRPQPQKRHADTPQATTTADGPLEGKCINESGQMPDRARSSSVEAHSTRIETEPAGRLARRLWLRSRTAFGRPRRSTNSRPPARSAQSAVFGRSLGPLTHREGTSAISTDSGHDAFAVLRRNVCAPRPSLKASSRCNLSRFTPLLPSQ